MQYKVPQDVQRADHIIGPLTLKHMIIIGAGGGVAYLIYVILARTYFWEVWLPPVAFVIIVTLIAAFVKVYNVSSGKFTILLFEYLLIPRTRKWAKSSGEVFKFDYIAEKQATGKKKKIIKKKNSAEAMKELKNITEKLDKYNEKIKSIK